VTSATTLQFETISHGGYAAVVDRSGGTGVFVAPAGLDGELDFIEADWVNYDAAMKHLLVNGWTIPEEGWTEVGSTVSGQPLFALEPIDVSRLTPDPAGDWAEYFAYQVAAWRDLSAEARNL
jgi:hypothetical protein